MTVTDAGGTYNGSAFPASASVTGVSGTGVLQPGGSDPDPDLLRGEHGDRHAARGRAELRGHVHRRRQLPRQRRLHRRPDLASHLHDRQGQPQVGLSTSGGSAVYGQTVSFVATVTAAGGTPTGTVTFSAGGTVLGTATLDSSGTATLNTTSLALGSSAITATYNGSANLGTATSGSESESVAKASTQIVLVPHPVRKGKKVISVGLEANVHARGTRHGDPHRHGHVRD